MGLLGSQQTAPTKINGIQISQSKQGFPVPVVMGQHKIQQSLLWLDGLHSVKESQGGKGGGKGGSSYLYTADVICALCAGEVTGIGNVWSGQTELSTINNNEKITNLSSTVYAPTFGGSLVLDLGAATSLLYDGTFSDFGSGGTSLSGSNYRHLKRVTYGTVLTSGEYSVNPDSIGTFAVTSVDASSGAEATYHGTFTGGASPYQSGAGNNLAGFAFTIAGFDQAANNGTFTCVTSTDSSITVSNANAVAETHAATATDPGNTYHFAASAVGTSVQISYQFKMTEFLAQETDLITSSLKITPGVSNGPQIDRGVAYYNNGNALDGKALTAVSGTPTVAGTYHFTSHSDAGPTYQFASGDVGNEVLISWGYENTGAVSGSADTLMNFELFNGSKGQAVAPYLLNGHSSSDNGSTYFNPAFPGEALGYTGIAYVLFYPMELGSEAQIQDNVFEVQTADSFGGGIVDCNPIQCLNQVLTNSMWGLGSGQTPFPASVIDATTWGSAGDSSAQVQNSTAYNWFAAQNFFISPVIDSQDSAAGVIGKWLEAGMCEGYMSEGLFKLLPLGDTSAAANGYTWVAPSESVVDLDDSCFVAKDGEDPVKIERSAWQDANNKVQVQFKNRSHQYADEVVQESDQSAINRFGLRLEDVQSYDFVTTLQAATFSANMRLKRSVNVRNTYGFTLPFNYSYLEPGDLVNISTSSQWATGNSNLAVDHLPVRITKIVDDPQIGLEVTCEDYVWGVNQPAIYDKGETSSTALADKYAVPGDSQVVMFEATDRLTQYAGNQIWIGALGTSSNWGACNVWVSQDQTKYLQVGTIKSPARLGELATSLPSGSDPDTADTMQVTAASNCGQLESGTQLDADSCNTLCFVDGELISYSTCALTAASTYTMSGYLRRGQMGSTIGAHAAGSLFLRLDDAVLKYTYDPGWAGKTLYFKFQSVNSFGNMPQDLSTLTPVTFTVPGDNPGTIDAETGLILQSNVAGLTSTISTINSNVGTAQDTAATAQTTADTATTIASGANTIANNLVSGTTPAGNTAKVGSVPAATVALATTGQQRNLVPDSDFKFGNTYWTSGLSVTGGLGADGGNALTYTGTGAASGYVISHSSPINVTPGVTYTLSGYIDATNVTSGSIILGLENISISGGYNWISQKVGQKGRVSASWTCPADLTQVVVICDTYNCIVASGSKVFWSNIQLEVGSVATAYKSNLIDDTTGTIAHGAMSTAVQTAINSSGTVQGVTIDSNGNLQGIGTGTGTPVKNSNITLSSDGTISGAGGGQVTFAGLGATGVIGSGNLCYNCDFGYSTGGVPTGFAFYNGGSISVTGTVSTGGALGSANYWRILANADVTNTFGFKFNTAITDFGGWKANTNYVFSFYAKLSANPNSCKMLDRWNYMPATTTWLQNPILTTSWQRYVIRVNFGSRTIDSYGYFTINPSSLPSGNYLDVSCLQVEQGDAPTGWAGPITASQIAANTITANQIASSTITAGQIAAGAIGATQLAANAVTADSIAAGAVTANSLTVCDWSNLCYNPGFEDGLNQWYANTNQSIVGLATLSTAITHSGINAAYLTSDGSIHEIDNGNILTCSPGDTYTASVWAYLDGTLSAGNAILYLIYSDKNGNSLGNNGGTVLTLTSGSWVQTRTTGTVPAGAVHVKLGLVNNGLSTGTVYLDDFDFRHCADASLIVDGSVTAQKLAANAIQTSNYATDSNGYPTAGARMDISSVALKVAPGNLQLGSTVFSDYLLPRIAQALDGDTSSGLVLYRGNVDATTRGGVPDIARLIIYGDNSAYNSTCAITWFDYDVEIQPSSTYDPGTDNLDALRYLQLKLYAATTSTSPFKTVYWPICDRLYNSGATAAAQNSFRTHVTFNYRGNYGGSSSVGYQATCYIRASLWNAYGQSAEKDFAPATTQGSALTATTITGSTASSGGGGGSVGGGCPAPWVPITLASGLIVNAGDLYDGVEVVGVDDITHNPATGIVRNPRRIWRKRMAVILADGRAPEFSLDHRVLTDNGWVAVQNLAIGQTILGSTPGVVKSLGTPAMAEVITFTVDGCHTYVSDGLISHNFKIYYS